MKALRTFVIAILVLNLLVAAGLVGYLLATGRLDGAKAQTIVDMLRAPGTPVNLRDGVDDLLHPVATASTAPAASTAKAPLEIAGPESTVASASDRIAYAQQAIEQERLRLDRQAQDLQNRQKLLDAQRRELDVKVAQLETDRKRLETQLATHSKTTQDANFTRMLDLYSQLKPQQVKSLFMAMDPELVSQYLAAMDTDRAATIIGEFRSDDEKSFLLGVLDRLRTSGTASALADSTTQANPPVVAAGQARN